MTKAKEKKTKAKEKKTKAKEKKTEDIAKDTPLIERVKVLEELVSGLISPFSHIAAVVRKIEKQFGLNLDRDEKAGGIMLKCIFAIALFVSVLYVTADPPVGSLDAWRDDVYVSENGFVAPDFTASDDVSITDDLSVGGDASVTGDLSLSKLIVSQVDNGSMSTGRSTIVENIGVVHRTVITLTMTDAAYDLDLPDGDHGAGDAIYTFPEGRILVLGAAINATVTNSADGFNATDNDHYYVSIGTADAGDDNDLTSTEADIIPKTTIDTAGGSDLSYEWEADMTAGGDSVFDGTASAVSLYLNAAIEDSDNDDSNSVHIAGTANIFFLLLGDD